MKSFEEEHARSCYERESRDRAQLLGSMKRKLTREERRRQARGRLVRMAMICIILAMLVTALAVLTVPAASM